MSSKKQQIQNSFIYLIPSLIDNLIPMITLPIFTRILFPEDYGVLALAQIYAMFAAGLANFGMLVAYDRNFFQYQNDRTKSAALFYTTISFIVFNSLVFGALTFLFRTPLSALVIRSSQFGDILFVSFCAECVVALRQYYLFYFRNGGEAKLYAANYVVSSVLTFFLSFIFVFWLRSGPIGVVMGRFVANVLTVGLLHQRILKRMMFVWDQKLLWESLKISFPLTPRIFFGVISTQFDKYMLGILSTVGGVGIYAIGQKLSNLIFVYMTSLQNVFQPQVYQRMFEAKEESAELIGKYLTPYIYLSLGIGVLVAFFSEEILWILTPPAYHGAANVITVLAMYYGFLFWGKITSVQLLYKKKTGLISGLMVLTIAANIIVSIPLIQRWGAQGAAWGTFLVGLISGWVGIELGQRCFKIKWEQTKIINILFTFFGGSLLLMTLKAVHVPYILRMVVKLGTLGYYYYFGVRLRIITRENLFLLKEVLSPKFFRKEPLEV